MLGPIRIVLVLALATNVLVVDSTLSEFSTLYKWINIEYGFPTAESRRSAIENGLYDPKPFKRIGAVDVDYTNGEKPRVFISTPRLSPGVPYTLATVSDVLGPNGPLLQPYPNLTWHMSHAADCGLMTSVFRFSIDTCGRLWALDFGKVTHRTVCPFKIFIFDLKTDKLLSWYTIPRNQYYPETSGLSAIWVDVVGSQCAAAKAYIVDARGFGILVYDLKTNRSWRVENDLFKADPLKQTMSIAGEHFSYPDGLYTIAVSPEHFKERYLYFHTLAGVKKNRVPLSLIANETIWSRNRNAHPELFETYAIENIHSAANAIDSSGNLYTSLVEPISFVAWNTTKQYQDGNEYVVAYNPETLQFASSMKVVRNRHGLEELWAVTVRLQKLALGTMSDDEVNFRIVACGVREMQSGTKCRVLISMPNCQT